MIFLSACNMRCPPTFNFFSEIYILLGNLSCRKSLMLLFSILLFLTGIYCVFFFVFFNHGLVKTRDISFRLKVREFLILLSHSFPLLAFGLFMGVL